MSIGTLLSASAKQFPSWGGGDDREKAAVQAALRKQVDEEAKRRWDDPAFHREVAALISEALTYTYQFQLSTGPYIRTVNVGEFDDYEVRKTKNGIRAFYTARGGYIEESQIMSERFTVPRDTIGFHVSEFEDKIRAGFAESMQDLIRYGGIALLNEANYRLFTTLNAALDAGGTGAVIDMGGAALTRDVVNDALRRVRDALRPDGASTPPVTIVGRAAAVDVLTELTSQHSWVQGTTNFGDLNQAATEEARRAGYIGTYKGANVVVLDNPQTVAGVPYFKEDVLWVFGGDAGVVVNYGGTRAKQWAENTSDYLHYRARQDFGVAVYDVASSVRIEDFLI